MLDSICVRPPAYLLEEGEVGIKKYGTTLKYYSAIEKLSPLLQVKYGDLRGSKGNLQEKNLDTQLATDMVTMAALGKFDTAILISNDGDYVSAVENVKNSFFKKVEVLFLMGRLSMALRQVCDLTRRARRSHFEKLDSKLTPLACYGAPLREGLGNRWFPKIPERSS